MSAARLAASPVTLGILARGDHGGLASICREVARHLAPARTLLIDVTEADRGPLSAADFVGHGEMLRATFTGAFPRACIDWVAADGIDTLWSAETFYQQDVLAVAHQRGIRTVVYAMPELAPWAVDPDLRPAPRTILTPTGWRLDRMPMNTTVLPMPVARDRLPARTVKEVIHLHHVVGTPFFDRNGTALLLAALPFVTAECMLTIRSSRPVDVPACGVDVEVELVDEPDYWRTIPPTADLLVMPRRYGGLCLPVQEAASLGVPSLMLASDPYASEVFVHAVPARDAQLRRMKGGMVPVFDADPRLLARAIDYLVEHPEVAASSSVAADGWAETHAWHGPLGARWREVLG